MNWKHLLILLSLAVGMTIGVAFGLKIETAWAAFSQTRLMTILNAAGTGEIILQDNALPGMPVEIVAGSMAAPSWTDVINEAAVAVCGVSSTQLGGAGGKTATEITINPDGDATTDLFCRPAGGVPDVDVGIRIGVGQAFSRVGLASGNTNEVRCCYETTSFKLSVSVF